jgi:Protein of unknown function (DUF3574)
MMDRPKVELHLTPFCLILATLLGCASGAPAPAPLPVTCPPGHNSLVRDGLYFGLTEPSGRQITDDEWEGFLSRTVTPAFPAGFTVLSARGQWRGNDGTVVKEPSRLLVLFHPPSAVSDDSIRAIISRYRTDFHQERVLWERSLACAAF